MIQSNLLQKEGPTNLKSINLSIVTSHDHFQLIFLQAKGYSSVGETWRIKVAGIIFQSFMTYDLQYLIFLSLMDLRKSCISLFLKMQRYSLVSTTNLSSHQCRNLLRLYRFPSLILLFFISISTYCGSSLFLLILSLSIYQYYIQIHKMNSEKQGQQIIRVMLVGRIYEQEEIFKIIKTIVLEFMRRTPVTFYFMDKRTKEKIGLIFPNFKFEIFNSQQHESIIDYVFTVGGDGTILYTAKEFKQFSPPFISFQRGTLGFLCKFTVDQLSLIVQKVIQSSKNKGTQQLPFIKTQLMRIEGFIRSQNCDKYEKKVCLNQIAIARKSSSRIILELYINDEFITQTAGDGLLIGTPTGSTAYALSAGGPVLQQNVNSILIVPIAPNSLSFRPICLSQTSLIKVRMSQKSRVDGMISFDGQSHLNFKIGDQIQIKKSSCPVTFYEPKPDEAKLPTWMQRLTQFLGWNDVFKSPKCQQPKIPSSVVPRNMSQDIDLKLGKKTSLI